MEITEAINTQICILDERTNVREINNIQTLEILNMFHFQIFLFP